MVEEGSKEGVVKPPYAPFKAMKQFLDRIKSISPPVIDEKFLATHEIAPKNESSIISALRYLKIIDESGKPSENLPLLQIAGDEYKSNLTKLLKVAYEQLFSTINIKTVGSTEIYNYFIKYHQYSPQMARKATNFFLGICQEAGMELSPELLKRTPTPPKIRKITKEEKLIRREREAKKIELPFVFGVFVQPGMSEEEIRKTVQIILDEISKRHYT